MNKIKTFWITFLRSLSGPAYYKDIVRSKISFSLKYFLFFVFFLWLGFVIYVSSSFLPSIDKALPVIKEKARNIYPLELVVKVRGGRLKTNVKEPYIIPVFYEGKTINLVTINTKAAADDIDLYGTLALVTSRGISVKDDNQVRTFLFRDMGDFTLDKRRFDTITAPYFKMLDYAVPITISFIAFLGLFAVFVGRFIQVFFYSLVTWAFGSLTKMNLPFAKYFQITLHAITPLIILQSILFLSKAVNPIPFGYVILYVIFLVFITRDLRSKVSQKR